FVGLGTPSLASLTYALTGTRLDKSEQLTDWSRRPLSSSARRYAAADVAYLLPIAQALEERLDAVGRRPWAQDEGEVLRHNTFGAGDPETVWWRIKGSRALRGKHAAVAQTVAAWRERRAQELDRQPRFVLSDLALAAIAARPPDSPEALARMRGAE